VPRAAAWYLGGSATLTSVSAANSFEACADACAADSACMYVTFSYDLVAGSKCSKKVQGFGRCVQVCGGQRGRWDWGLWGCFDCCMLWRVVACSH
jgi:hypothetical protein